MTGHLAGEGVLGQPLFKEMLEVKGSSLGLVAHASTPWLSSLFGFTPAQRQDEPGTKYRRASCVAHAHVSLPACGGAKKQAVAFVSWLAAHFRPQFLEKHGAEGWTPFDDPMFLSSR